MHRSHIRQWVLVGVVAIAIAVLNVIRVIMGAFQTPAGQTYLAIGHSYIDYLEYTQQIAQGIYGHTQILNQFTTHDPTATLIGWGQYLFIGYVARIFGASPFVAYWTAVFLLSVATLLLLFLLVSRLLPRETFTGRLLTYLIAVFAAPFFVYHCGEGLCFLKPVEFFYSPISLFHRIGGIPHHLTTTVFVIALLILSASFSERIHTNQWRSLSIRLFLFLILTGILLTFAPLQTLTLLGAVCIGVLLEAIGSWRKTGNIRSVLPYIGVNAAITLTIVPLALLIDQVHGSQELFLRAIQWERTQQFHPAASEFLGSIGPLLLFLPFGLRRYFGKPDPIRLIFFLFVTLSYCFFASDLAYYFGTFNMRFLTPLSYALLGVLSYLAICDIARWMRAVRIVKPLLLTGLLLYGIIGTLIILQSFGPSNQLGYMPNDFFSGIQMLNAEKNTKAVLTSSYHDLGILVPSVIDRNVYLGRLIFTPDFVAKQDLSDRFYAGYLFEEDARQFLRENNIGYIIVATNEPYPKEPLLKYPFIREFFTNPFMTILKVTE